MLNNYQIFTFLVYAVYNTYSWKKVSIYSSPYSLLQYQYLLILLLIFLVFPAKLDCSFQKNYISRTSWNYHKSYIQSMLLKSIKLFKITHFMLTLDQTSDFRTWIFVKSWGEKIFLRAYNKVYNRKIQNCLYDFIAIYIILLHSIISSGD